MVPPGGHQGHDQFIIVTYKSEVLNKTQVSDPGSLDPLLVYANIIVHEKCCFHL